MNDNGQKEGHWAIVELFGHKVVAGFAAQDERWGAAMLRVDVPETTAFEAFTQFYGLSSVYGITPVSEDVARMAAESHKTNPVSVYVPELVTRRQHEKVVTDLREQMDRLRNALPAGVVRNEDGDDDEGEDLDDDERPGELWTP